MSDHHPDDDERTRVASNIGFAVVVVILLAVGWWLIDSLVRESKLEDCLFAHRQDCAVVETPHPSWSGP